MNIKEDLALGLLEALLISQRTDSKDIHQCTAVTDFAVNMNWITYQEMLDVSDKVYKPVLDGKLTEYADLAHALTIALKLGSTEWVKCGAWKNRDRFGNIIPEELL